MSVETKLIKSEDYDVLQDYQGRGGMGEDKTVIQLSFGVAFPEIHHHWRGSQGPPYHCLC